MRVFLFFFFNIFFFFFFFFFSDLLFQIGAPKILQSKGHEKEFTCVFGLYFYGY